ncbi:MAG: hypothetical protein RSF83_02075 [Hungatella sp.]
MDIDEFMNLFITGGYADKFGSGWILAFFQWKTGRSFRDIMSYECYSKPRDAYNQIAETTKAMWVFPE